MAEKIDKADDNNTRESRRPTKKPYQEPAFRYERVFETMALSCGKMSPVQLQCSTHRKVS